jgi:DNA-binding response OmpR family regulator
VYRSPWFCSGQTFCLTSPNGKLVRLTPTELLIICLFSKKNETLLTKDDFSLALNKMNVQGFDKNLKVVVNRLKKKVLEETNVVFPLVNIRNVGYEFRGVLSSFLQEEDE